VLAHEDTVRSTFGSTYRSTAEFEDDPEAPRIGYIPDETIGNAEGAVFGAGVYVPAMVGSLAAAASGGSLLGVFAAAVFAGGAGGLIGAALARFIGHEHARHLDQHLHHGGLLLWVRTRDAERERQALEISDAIPAMMFIYTRSRSAPARKATSHVSARGSFISSTGIIPSTSFAEAHNTEPALVPARDRCGYQKGEGPKSSASRFGNRQRRL
jgi:hypothetical protein